jgi:hypothetical protein
MDLIVCEKTLLTLILYVLSIFIIMIRVHADKKATLCYISQNLHERYNTILEYTTSARRKLLKNGKNTV